ncbi:serine/threonine-protein kinase [Nocardioides plantarum]|uniref:non-specific serine/threonine protein kinase n=1 Tax=Nocardioides plantarum TaxID=29299 RepID=A0ABV5K7C3_9ACTN|nr:serine/threonine-protein kinase [Nocardioides plantarum]
MTGAPEIPGYTFLQHLGSGGFADVFLFEQEWPRQRVAVKVVRPDVSLTEREKGLFAAEANAMAKLADHPYIVSVITAGMTGGTGPAAGRPYLVMRYCPPPDLGVRVRQSPMPVADALSTGIKLASAVETAHRAGIVHRDIKPSNVLVTTYSEPALTDFGIAGYLHEIAAESEVRISYPWSPPELLDGRSNGSVASDVYSLGATIWNLLTGRSPFAVQHGDNTPRALSARILHTPAPATGRPDVPPALEALLAQCLAKPPEHRPGSALELARALQRVESQAGYARTAIAVEGDRPAGEGSAPPPPSGDPDATYVKPITVIPASGPRAARIESAVVPGGAAVVEHGSRAAWVWAVLGVLVVAAVVVALALRGGGEEEPPAAPPPTTPAPVEDGLVQLPPQVDGVRRGAQVVFTWRAADAARGGDTFEWRRTDTDEGARTADPRVTVKAASRVCVQVRLIRGSDASAFTERCVD